MSTFGTGTTTTGGSSIVLTAFSGTNGVQAGTDGLVPGPAVAQQGYLLGAGGDWTLEVKAIADLTDSSARIATTDFVQTLLGQAQLGGGNANLSALGDTQFAGLVADQFLQYNGNKWVNVTFNLDSIADVDLAGLQDGNALVYDATANGGAGGWVPGQGGGGGAENLNELTDVTIAGVANKHFLVNNGAGQFVNRIIDTTDLSNSADIVLTTAGSTFGAFAYDFTGVTSITVPAPTANTHASTKKYVDDSVATKQPLEATLTGLANLAPVDGDIIIATGNDTFGVINVSANVETFLGSTANLTALSDVTLGGVGLANGQALKYKNGVWINEALDFSELSGTANVALLNANQTFTGIVLATTQAVNDNTTKLATTAYVEAQIDNDITALNLGATYQAKDASLDDITGIVDGDLLLGDGANSFEKVNVSAGVETFLKGTASISSLSDVHTLAGIQAGNVLAWTGNNRFEFTAPAQTYTDEEARNASGTALANGVHTGISFVNDDANDRINATVSLGGFSIGALSDVNLANVVNDKILKYNNGSFIVADETDTQLSNEQVQDIVGPMFTANNAGNTHITFAYDDTGGANDGTITAVVSLASTDLTDTANLARLNAVQTFSANATFTANVDLTGATATALTQNASDNSTKVATTAYVDAQIDADIVALNLGATYQGLNTNLTSISGLNIVDGSMMIGNGNNSFEILSIALGVENFLKSTGRIAALSDVTFNGNELNNANHFIVSTGAGGFQNQTISTANLSNSADIVLTSAGATFGAFAYDFTGVTSITAPAPTANTHVATKLYVDNKFAAGGGALDDLDDVTIGAKADAQILVLNYTNDGDDTNDIFHNVSLSGDITITNAGVATIGNGKVTTAKILDGNVSNAKLANSSLTVGSTAISLGGTSTTLSGMTGIDFTNTDATIGASMTTNLGNPTTLTLGGAGSKVIISGDLQVSGTTTTVDTTNMVIEDRVISLNSGVAGANADDIGLFFDRGNLDPALFIWDESDDVFKVGTENGATASQAGAYNLSLKGLQVASPALGDDSNLASTTAWVTDYFQPLDATLTALAGVATNANKLIYATAADTFTTTDLTVFARQILDDADAGAVRTTLGLGTASTKDIDFFLEATDGLNALTDVNLGITNGDGVALANAQILVYDSDGGNENDKWKNVSLSSDLTITNAGVATIANSAVSTAKLANDSVTTAKILDGNVTNAKLDNSSLTVGSTSISLGGTSTTLSGMTAIDFTNANATIGATMTDDGAQNPTPTTLTLGGAGSKVVIAGSLEITGTLHESLNSLSDVTIANPADKHFLVSNGAGVFSNRTISTADLSNSDKIALTTAGSTFGAFAYDFTASTVSVNAPNADAHASTKKYVDDTVAAISFDGLTDVNLGVKVGDATSVALTNAQILIYDDDAGDEDNKWKNKSLSGDITISNAGVATIGNGKVTNIKLDNSSLTVGSTAISLGGTSTTLSGMTGIDFTNANATIGATMTDDGAGTSTTLTLGGAGSTVAITGTLTVNAPANDTDASTKKYVDDGLATKQPLDATLTALAGVATDANKLIYATAADTFTTTDITAFARSILDDADVGTVRATLGLGDAALVGTTETGGGVADAGKAVITDAQGKLGAIDGANLTALGSIGLHSNVDLTDLAHGQGLVYSTTNGVNRFEPGTIPTTGTNVDQSPTITAQSISLNPNALVGGDLVIYGRVMEVIDYGTDLADGNGVDLFDPATDFAIDFGSVTDTVLYCADDYGVLVV